MKPLDYKDIFIQNLTYYLDLSNRKAIDITKALQIPKSTVSSWMTKKRYPKMSTIEKLAVYLNVSKAELIEEHGSGATLPLTQYPFVAETPTQGVPYSIAAAKTLSAIGIKDSTHNEYTLKNLPTIGLSNVILDKYAGDKKIVIVALPHEKINELLPNSSFAALKTDVELQDLPNGSLIAVVTDNKLELMIFHTTATTIELRPFSADSGAGSRQYGKKEPINLIGKVIALINGFK